MNLPQQNHRLFADKRLDEVLRAEIESIPAKVDAIPKDQFVATSNETLVEHLVGQMEWDPLVIFEDRMEMETQESRMDVSREWDRNPFDDRGPIMYPSTRVTVSVPFTGNLGLWSMRSNPFWTTVPFGNVRRAGRDGVGFLDIVVERPHDASPDETKRLIDQRFDGIRRYVGAQAKQVETHNAALADRVGQAVQARRARLEKQDGLAATLGIPLRRREGAPPVEPIKVQRKLVRPLPPAPKSGANPEPGISTEDYEHILGVVRHEGRSFETTPRTFAKHDEEGLRDIVLAHLNGHYEGGATGETFRKTGKTDIRIVDGDRAAFVAECKIWRGPGSLADALDQLLGYLTWRDCKAAMVIFNTENTKFFAILGKVRETMTADSGFLREVEPTNEAEWRFVFRSREDEGREVTVHAFAFDLFVSAK